MPSLKVDRSKSTDKTPLYVRGLARHLMLSESVIYRALREQGYQYQFPRLRMSTPEHFLAWAAQPCEPHSTTDAAAERLNEEERLLKEQVQLLSAPKRYRKAKGGAKS